MAPSFGGVVVELAVIAGTHNNNQKFLFRSIY
jgi:hypothetical protein